MFTRHRIIILLAATVLLLGAIFYAVLRPAHTLEPSYGGKTLSDWLTSRNMSWQCIFLEWDVRVPQTEAAAIRAMGTNSIPFLLEWIQYESPALKAKIFVLNNSFSWSESFKNRLLFKELRAENAAIAFVVLGSRADEVIPELTRLMNTSSSAIQVRAAHALGGIGKAALPPLMAILTNRRSDPDGTVMSAIRALGRLKLQSDLVVPALTNFLTAHEPILQACAADTLEQFGTEARPAVLFLQKLLNDSDLMVRESATNALLKIAPEALTNAPAR
jgi:hypothetical protein